MQYVDENEVEHRRRSRIEADFQQVVVVRRDAETRHEAVDHQVYILTHAVLTAREQLRCVEQKSLSRITSAANQHQQPACYQNQWPAYVPNSPKSDGISFLHLLQSIPFNKPILFQHYKNYKNRQSTQGQCNPSASPFPSHVSIYNTAGLLVPTKSSLSVVNVTIT